MYKAFQLKSKNRSSRNVAYKLEQKTPEKEIDAERAWIVMERNGTTL